MSGIKNHVFVSYARADAHLVEPIIQSLRREGMGIWLDQESIEGGTFWRREIVQAIKECAIVLFFVSRRSCASDNVSRELALANEEKKPILPVFIEEVEPSSDLRYQIAGLHHIVWQAQDEQSLLRIIATLRRYAPRSERARAEPLAGRVSPRRRLNKAHMAVLATAFIAALLSAVLVYRGVNLSLGLFPSSTKPAWNKTVSGPRSGQPGPESDHLSGSWYIETVTKTSDYRPYLDMRLRFKVLLTQNGSALDARGEKIGEVTNGEERELTGRAKTPIYLTGHIENRAGAPARIVLSGDEGSATRSRFSTMFELDVQSPDLLVGSFKSTAANSGGSAVWTSEKQWLSRGWESP